MLPSLRSETLISAGAVSGTWALTNSPYIVQGTVNIQEGTTLTIEPGVVIRFAPSASMVVYGALTAAGTPLETILFTSASSPAPGAWNGLQINNLRGATHNVFRYVEINSATTALNAVRERDDLGFTVTLADSLIYSNAVNGLGVFCPSSFISGEEVQITGSRIYHNGETGIYISSVTQGCSGSGNQTLIQSNQIYRNGHFGVRVHAGASAVSGCLPRRTATAYPSILANVLHNNASGGIGWSSSSGINNIVTAPSIMNNLVTSNGSHGIAVVGAVIMHNTVAHNSGPGIDHGSIYHVQNNLVAHNTIGIRRWQEFPLDDRYIWCNNVFANTLSNWTGYPEAVGTASTTNRNGTPADVYMNISISPQFVGDRFTLRPTSPCVNAGVEYYTPPVDYEGQRRGAYPDIGYDELLFRPTFLTPVIQGAFKTAVTGEPGVPWLIEASSNLFSWAEIAVITNVTGSVFVTNELGPLQRFFRGKELP